MLSTKKMLEEVSQFLESKKLKENYKDVLSCLFKIYKQLLKDNIIILDYYISKDQHYISLKLNNERNFVNLSVTNKCVEILFTDNSEQILFFDDKLFCVNSCKLIHSFLGGKYETISYKNEKGHSVLKEIKWKEENLSVFNIKYYTGRLKQYEKIEKTNGLIFLK